AAAALVRGQNEPERASRALPAACAWGAVAAIGGLWLWSPHGAWPEWYTFLWLPALVGVIFPAPRRWALVGMAVVAGTAGALLAWGAAVEGRLALATRDGQGLGQEGDAVAVALLERVSQQVTDPSHTPPRSPGIHYVLLAPLANGTVLTVAVGPRSLYLPPDRVARFLRGAPGAEPPYTITVSLPTQTGTQPVSNAVQWRREQWSARGERR